MANKSLTDLTARTATADSDLIHVNSGGTDYKETKFNFLEGGFHYIFANTSSITSQVDALSDYACVFGTVANSSSVQATLGLPLTTSGRIQAQSYNANFKEIKYIPNGNMQNVYVLKKISGTWQSTWTIEPTRDEITSLNNSLTQRLIDISSQFTWNTSLSAVNKGVVAYYDPYTHSVRGSFYINVSSSFASTTHMLVAPSGYRPSSTSAWIGVLSTTTKDTNFYFGSILTDGKFTQSLTSVCMGVYGQFEYKI